MRKGGPFEKKQPISGANFDNEDQEALNCFLSFASGAWLNEERNGKKENDSGEAEPEPGAHRNHKSDPKELGGAEDHAENGKDERLFFGEEHVPPQD